MLTSNLYLVIILNISWISNIYCFHVGKFRLGLQNILFKGNIIDQVPLRPIYDTSSTENFLGSFVSQKNHLVLEKLRNPTGNITEMAREYLNFCDISFSTFLDEQIAQTENATEKTLLGRIRYEVNMARRNRLLEADGILREILSAGGLKQMEGKLYGYLRRGEIDMAFMVMLQLNIEDAMQANVTTAVQILKHLETLINEYQDQLMSPPVLLIRLLVRENDGNVRKQMLRQKLLIGPNANIVPGVSDPTPVATTSPQCEHIVVQPVADWGGPDVGLAEFYDTINDILSQMGGGSAESLADMEVRCNQLLKELQEVLDEFECGTPICSNKNSNSDPLSIEEGGEHLLKESNQNLI